MAEINRLSVFRNAANSPRRALVDSQDRIVAVLDAPILQQPGGVIPGGNNVVPGGVETTIVSFIVPTGLTMYLTGWTGTGNADAVFKFYINGIQSDERRNSAAQMNVDRAFVNPAEVGAGVTVSVKVRHERAETRRFFCTLEGYLRSI